MIEINLLPPQYRSVERTPMPVFLGLIGGLAMIGVALGFLGVMIRAAQRAEEEKIQLTQERDRKKVEAAAVDQLQRDIQEAQGRVDTVLGIAESKIYWGMKLDQLVRIIPPTVWIDSLNMQQRPNGGELKLACNARGVGLNRFTEFTQALRSDTNFFYHFDAILASTINVVPTDQKTFIDAEYLQFPMTLPLGQVELGGPRR